MFTPQGYQPPKSNSNYLKFVDGDNVIRILSKPIMGWLDWKEENGKRTPVRTPYNQPKPKPLNAEKPVKHFWAMTVWDYKENAIKVLEITQTSIQEALFNLDTDEAWGEPTLYDINVKKAGEKLDTKYNVIARPPKPLDELINNSLLKVNPNLNELFSNGDPFKSGSMATDYGEVIEDPEIKPENIPF